jgi:hypothetical protein
MMEMKHENNKKDSGYLPLSSSCPCPHFVIPVKTGIQKKNKTNVKIERNE